MRRKMFIFQILLLSLALQLSPVCAKDSAASLFAHESSDLQPDPAVRWGRLENGLRYAILQNAEPKGRASLRLAVMAGSLHEKDEQRGIAHFLEHLAFNGSTHFPPGTLVEYFQRLGMSFGGDTNASTDFDRTIYQLELPDTHPQTLQQAFTLFADYGGGLSMTPEFIEKERGIILAERRDRDSKAVREWLARMEFLLPNTRITQRLPIGTPEVIQQAKRDTFVDYYDTWYRPERMVVVAVGDFDPAKIEAQLTAALSPLKARAPAQPVPELGKVTNLKRTAAKFYHEPESANITIAMDIVSPHKSKTDSKVRRIDDLPLVFAQAMLNRRLAILAKAADAAIVDGNSYVSEMHNFMFSAGIGVSCRDDKQWQSCLASAEHEVRRVVQYGFQPQELREVTAIIRNSLEQSVRMAGTRSSAGLAEGLVSSVIDQVVFTAPEADRALLTPALDKITVEDCHAAFRKVWSDSAARRIFVSGKLPMSERDILSAYDTGRRQAVNPLEAKHESQFAYTTFGGAGKVTSRRHISDLDVTLVEFENGVRLNIKPTPFDAGAIFINARVGGGVLSAPRDKPGLATLAANTFIAGGLGKHSSDDLRSIFAGRSLAYSFGADGDAFVLSGGTTADDLLLQLQVLTAFAVDPGYRPEAMRQFQKGVDQVYAEMAHAVAGPWETEIPLLLAGGDSRFGLPADKKILLSRTYEEVRAWLDPQLRNGPIEIAMVGDLNVDKVIEAVGQTFGALPQRQTKPAYEAERQVNMPTEPVRKRYSQETELPQGLVDVRWPATDKHDIRRARRIDLLAAVFADRLRLKLREQMGQAYSPSVQDQLSETFVGYGFISASASVDPERAIDVADAIKSIAADLAKNGVTDDELARAREPALTSIRASARENAYWMNVLSGVQELPEKLDWCRSREADYASITVKDLTELARKYLTPERASEFISVPVKPGSDVAAGNPVKPRSGSKGG